MMTCNRILSIFLFFLIITLPALCVERGSVKYEENLIDYSVLDADKILSDADSFFAQYELTKDKKFLNTAMGNYYIVTKIYPLKIYPMVQLARTYDERQLDKFAKEYFNICLDINRKDPYLNYYLGDFYYKRRDYKRAMRYFKIAYDNGYQNYYDLNYKIATIYEKFADLIKAKYYYEKAYSIDTSKTNLKDKTLQIDSLNYDKSDYYRIRK